MAGHAAALRDLGAEAIIAGCTEVPLVLTEGPGRVPFLDAGALLAKRCVNVCLGLEPLPVA